MSRYFKRLHGRQEPPGLELEILRRLPKALLLGTLAPLALSVIVRMLPAADTGLAESKRIMSMDVFVFAAVLTIWTAVLTISIGCIVVYIMKGPAYVADAYPLQDAGRPAGDRDERRT